MLVFWTYFLLSFQVLFSSGQITLERNSQLDNWFPNTPLTTVGVVRSKLECATQCQAAGCMSIVYESVQKVCHLNDRISRDISECTWKLDTTHYKVVSGIVNGYDCDTFNDSCMKMLPAPLTWTEGRDACASDGATLLIIDSSDKQSAIQQYMIDEGLDYVWLGINDQVQEGDWRTQDGGSLPAYSNFSPGQPDDSNSSQDCALVVKGWGYKWDDITCGYSNNVNVVCEMK